MLYTRPFIAENAVAYAERWALERNPLFENFTGRGGDCTNFVSQAILAGSCKMNFTKDFGWYFIDDADRAPAWSGVEYFYAFITRDEEFLQYNGGIGPFGREVSREEVLPGDVVQLANELGDFYHTLIVTRVENGEILVSAHSDDALNRALSTYTYTTDRFIRIEGVNVDFGSDCFQSLIDGTNLPLY